MSQKPVDIDEMIASLKLDGSTPEIQLKARKKLNVPHRPSISRYGLVGATVGIAAFVFWPRVTAGTTWAQALNSSSQAQIVHYIGRNANGAMMSEEWTRGDKTARTIQLSNGKLFLEWRTDGKKTFCFSDFQVEGNRVKNPNYRLFGEVYTGNPGFSYSLSSTGTSIEQLLKLRQTKIIKQEPISHNGTEATRYELQSQMFRNERYFAIVDKKSGLIVETESTSKRWKATYEYPNTVDERLFEPRAQSAKNLDVYDVQMLKTTLASNLSKGLGTSSGVTLRSATMDANGNLWVLWTGSSISSKLERPFSISGVKLSNPSGLKKFTSNAAKSGLHAYEVDSNGSRIYGMSRTALSKVGSIIDVSIPTKSGIAIFRNVPVLRIGHFQTYRPWSPKQNPAPAITRWRVPNKGQ